MKNNAFIKCCLKYSWLFVIELILAFALAQILVEGNNLVGESIDEFTQTEHLNFNSVMITLIILTISGMVAAFFKSLVASQFSVLVQREFKELVGRKIYSVEYKYFDANSSAAVLNKMNDDIAQTDAFLSENLPDFCVNIVSTITYAVYVGRMNLTLLLLMLICYPVIFVFTIKIARRVRGLRFVHQQKRDKMIAVAQDSISGILPLRSFGAEDYFEEKLNEAADELVENEQRRTKITTSAQITRRMLQWVPTIICAVYAYTLVLSGEISIGGLMAFFLVLQRFVDVFIGLPFEYIDMQECLVCVSRVNAIIREKDEPSGEYTGDEADKADTIIRFDNVRFGYGERLVLDNLSFEIKRGKSVSLVGESGGGKSTIFHLICGFYQPQAGEYSLYGRSFADWNIKSARANIALVSQNVFLFPTTVRENVAFGNLKASEADIIEACKKARIHDFIEQLPSGYDTIVGERGVLLSGGEKQRISIARAFLKNAPLLLLDEPTSAIDVETEGLIQAAIDELAANRTCITIAHRLSTVKNADEIMVVDKGRIVERGTHSELLKLNGAYSTLYSNDASLSGGEQ